MKKILVLLLALAMCFSICACGGGGGTPQEQLNAYLEKNGTQIGEGYEYVYEPGAEIIKANSPLGDLGNNTDAMTTEEVCTISSEGGVLYIEVIDKEVSINGITMDRGAKVNIAEGTVHYHNSLIYDGVDIGGTMEVSVPVSGYTADAMPTINSLSFMSGSEATDDMKAAMQGYVNLALDCFADFVENELGLTIADFGYEAYVPAK